MPLPNIFNSLNTTLKEMQISEILRANEKSQKYGLSLTAGEAAEIVEARNHILQNYGRVEIDAGITGKLIHAFCPSPYINQEEYLSTLKELQEVFYYLKNETEDEIGDDELINIIKDSFNNNCGGSVELLEGMELDAFARSFKRRIHPAYNSSEGE